MDLLRKFRSLEDGWSASRVVVVSVVALAALESLAMPSAPSPAAIAKIAGVLAAVTGVALLALRASLEHSQVAGVCGAAIGGAFGLLLTTGRRASAWAVRVPVVAACVVLVGALVFVAIRMYEPIVRRGPRAARLAASSCFALAVFVAFANAHVLVRTYPVFHAGMLLTACGLCAVGVRFLDRARQPRFGASTAAVFLVAALGFIRVPEVELRKSGFGQVVAAAADLPNGDRSRGAYVDSLRGATPSISRLADAALNSPTRLLTGRSILVITVDALRADALAASPELEALREESTSFAFAYTTTPNTSYALATLWSGELVVPSTRVPSPTPTWIARRFASEGYTTMALYPPDVFFVDESRFRAAKSERFGFEQASVDRVDAPEMAARLATMLAEVPDGKPILAWVHILEPHEPYVAATGQDADAPARARYDSEVRTVGRAVASLKRIMRASRPDSTVVLTADHGEEFGEHGGKFHGTTLYEEQVRIPLMFDVAGAARPGTSHVGPVSLLDVPATLLALHGIVPGARMLGRDLGACIDESNCAMEGGAIAVLGSSWMISDGETKVIVNEEDAEGAEVYALRSDPHEEKNVWRDNHENEHRLMQKMGAFRAELSIRTTADPDAAILRRYELGERGDLDTLLRVVASENPAQRADAVRYLSEANWPPLLTLLPSVLEDSDARVRAEAALASCRTAPLDANARARLIALVISSSDLEFVSRSARVLGEQLPPSSWDAVLAVTVEPSLDRAVRRGAIAALGAAFSASQNLRGRPAQEVSRARDRMAFGLGTLLADLVLRVDAADALGRLGGRAAQGLLWQALTTERYPLARAAELVALARLRDKRVESLSYELAQDSGSISEPARVLCEVTRGLRLRSGPASLMGCACTLQPSDRALVCELPKVRMRVRGRSAVRIYATIHAPAAASFLPPSGRVERLRAGPNEVSFCVRSEESFVLPRPEGFAYSAVAWVSLEPDVSARDPGCVR